MQAVSGERKSLFLWVPKELHTQLKVLAAARERTMAEVVTKALARELQSEEEQRAVQR